MHRVGHSAGDRNEFPTPCQFPGALFPPISEPTLELWLYIVFQNGQESNLWSLVRILSSSIEANVDTPSKKCVLYFPRGERTVHSSLHSFLDRHSWESEVDMQLREKAEETSNRLLDVRGHFVPEVIYIYLSPSLPLVSLCFSLEGATHSLSHPTSTLADSNRWPSANKLASLTFIPKLSPFLTFFPKTNLDPLILCKEVNFYKKGLTHAS